MRRDYELMLRVFLKSLDQLPNRARMQENLGLVNENDLRRVRSQYHVQQGHDLSDACPTFRKGDSEVRALGVRIDRPHENLHLIAVPRLDADTSHRGENRVEEPTEPVEPGAVSLQSAQHLGQSGEIPHPGRPPQSAPAHHSPRAPTYPRST